MIPSLPFGFPDYDVEGPVFTVYFPFTFFFRHIIHCTVPLLKMALILEQAVS